MRLRTPFRRRGTLKQRVEALERQTTYGLASAGAELARIESVVKEHGERLERLPLALRSGHGLRFERPS